MKKVICVTGGSDGLGRAIAEYFSKTDTVVVLAQNEEKLKNLQKSTGVNYYVCDVRNSTQVESIMSRIISDNKRIDVLINSAGVLVDGELLTNSFDEIKVAIDTNLTGLINVTKAVIPFMKSQKQGTILNINSQAGIGSGKAEKSIYNASKWGVTGFSKCIQPELAKYGIRVTDIFPGRMNTNMFKKVGLERDMSMAISMEDMVKVVQFIIELPNDIVIPEIGIKHINN